MSAVGRGLTTKNLNVVDFQCLLCISKACTLGHFKVLLIIVKRRNFPFYIKYFLAKNSLRLNTNVCVEPHNRSVK